jgi:hypothetical protein
MNIDNRYKTKGKAVIISLTEIKGFNTAIK